MFYGSPYSDYLTTQVSARYDLETEENGSSLVIRGVEAGDGGQYTCQVSVHYT